jgi:hypothetical protein
VRNGSGVEFNDQVAKFKDLIDAVTIHDYTSQWAKDEHAPTKNEKWERLILYGPKIIPVYAEGVRTLFGADKQIWMTEFNVGPSANKPTRFTVGRFIFVFNYLIAASCNGEGRYDIMMMHRMWTQSASKGSYESNVCLPWTNNDPAQVEYNVIGMLFALLGHVSTDSDVEAKCVKFNEKARCPVAATQSYEHVECLRGLHFSKSSAAGNVTALYVTNGCNRNISIDVATILESSVFRDPHRTTNYTLRVYNHDQVGNFTVEQSCPDGTPLFNCGPVMPADQRVVPASSTSTIDVPPLSLVVIATQSWLPLS